MEENIRAKLLEAIRAKAYKTGEFTLASGEKSSYYIDLKEVTLDAAGALLTGRAVYGVMKDWGADAAGGMELGAVPISTAVSLVSALEGGAVSSFIVRKKVKGHGAGKRIEGAVGPGSRVVVVEDVVSTGGSSLKAVEALREAGAEIVGVVPVVDREMGGREVFENRGLRYSPVFTLSDIKGSGGP
ncbi:MAG: orotate phosphoribosyltransferase [Candidatus Nitrospinota bacterium M3_3B_026]